MIYFKYFVVAACFALASVKMSQSIKIDNPLTEEYGEKASSDSWSNI